MWEGGGGGLKIIRNLCKEGICELQVARKSETKRENVAISIIDYMRETVCTYIFSHSRMTV